jgi:hypothetical protein
MWKMEDGSRLCCVGGCRLVVARWKMEDGSRLCCVGGCRLVVAQGKQ